MKILNIAATSFELYYLSSIALLLRKKNQNISFDLLIDTKLIKNIIISDEIKKIYSRVYEVYLPGLTPSTKKIFSNIKRGWNFKKFLEKFDLRYDALFINSYNEFFSNIIYKHLPKTVKLIICTTYKSKEIQLISKIKWPLLLSFLLCEKIYGYSLTEYHWSLDKKRIIHKKIKKYPKHTLIFISDHPIDDILPQNTIVLPPPFHILKTLFHNTYLEEKAILVSGERTPLYPSWGKKDKEIFDNFFKYLKTEFSDYKLYFIPRRGYTDMNFMKPLLSGFHIMDTREPIEEILAKRHFDKIISIKSTVCRLGMYYGIPSYILYPLFDMPKDRKSGMVDSVWDDILNIIRVEKLADLKKLPQNKMASEDLKDLYYTILL